MLHAAAAAGRSDLAAQASAQHMRDAPAAPADSTKHKVLRLLPLGGGWLRATQSVPHCSLPHKRHHPAAQQVAQQQQLSFKQVHSVLDKPDVVHDALLQPVHGRKLKARVHKLLAWASGRTTSVSSSAAASPQVLSAPLGAYGSLTFVPGASGQQQQQQPQGVPIPWQHQVFTEPSVQPSVQLIHAVSGEQLVAVRANCRHLVPWQFNAESRTCRLRKVCE
jgi:hypothetical protein